MKILSTSVYHGPSIYALFPVIRHVVDLGDLEQWPSARLGAVFTDQLLEALPGLHEHGCSYGTAGGFVRRLREDEGTWLGHVMEHVAIELQNIAGSDVTFGKTRSNGLPNQYDMVYEYEDKSVGLEAGQLALSLLTHLLPTDLRPSDTPADVFDFEKAQDHGRTVIVESFIEGLDHRLLVVNGELIAASKRVPGHVVGDGIHNIEWLVEEVNKDPRRGVGHEKVLTRLEFDAQAEKLLDERGYARDTVPEQGEVVYLRKTANLSTGGTAVDVTDIIHPDNREMTERAVKAIGLDVGGVDFLTRDISESYRVTGGAICEVNAAPGFRMHVAPSEGTPRDVAGPVIDMLFPPGAPSRLPIAAITGTNGKTTTARMLAHIFKLAGHTVGMTSSDGVYIDGRLTVQGDMTGPASARMVLQDPDVDAAVLETARGGLLRSGMGYRESNVSACLNVAADHLGLRGIDTVEQLAEVKRVVIEVARDTVVLNADDPLCLKMADHSHAERICYVTMNHAHALVKEHIRAGGLAVVLEQGMNGHMIALYDRGQHVPLLWTHLIPATLEGRALHNVQNAMFAAAMAHSMGISLENVRHGLRTFDSTFFQAPGRMNVYDEHPFKVILDYAHNPAAVRTVCQVVDRFDVSGRKILVLAAPGDRRDEDIRGLVQAACTMPLNRVLVKNMGKYNRGRPDGEVAAIIREEFLRLGLPARNLALFENEMDAVRDALAWAQPGDLAVLLIHEDRDGVLDYLRARAEMNPKQRGESL